MSKGREGPAAGPPSSGTPLGHTGLPCGSFQATSGTAARKSPEGPAGHVGTWAWQPCPTRPCPCGLPFKVGSPVRLGSSQAQGSPGSVCPGPGLQPGPLGAGPGPGAWLLWQGRPPHPLGPGPKVQQARVSSTQGHHAGPHVCVAWGDVVLGGTQSPPILHESIGPAACWYTPNPECSEGVGDLAPFAHLWGHRGWRGEGGVWAVAPLGAEGGRVVLTEAYDSLPIRPLASTSPRPPPWSGTGAPVWPPTRGFWGFSRRSQEGLLALPSPHLGFPCVPAPTRKHVLLQEKNGHWARLGPACFPCRSLGAGKV